MKKIPSFFSLLIAIFLSASAVAETTKIEKSPEIEIPRINAKKYDYVFGINYAKSDDGKVNSTSPMFPITKHKVTPGEGRKATLGVEIPVNATIVSVRGLMRNEPWGGSRKPPKQNTDDLGSVDFKPCPMGNGDCPIAWSNVSSHSDAIDANGRRFITAVFRNWAGRNDRTGMLEVTYRLPD